MKKKILYTSLSFLLPLTILLVIFKINGLFDDKTIISGDMHAQYYPLFNYLKEIFNGNNNFFYSFNKGLGGTMFGTFFYYLSSPLNLLLILVNKTNIPEFMTYLIIIKLSLCGLTMFIYMSHKFKKNNLLILSLSLCYALMGYNLNYFINIMWLDVVFLTPLVLLGIDKIINNKSPIMYVITLFISIISNYYLSYMLCIFCVIYFIYEISLKNIAKRAKKQLFKKFIILSLLSGLMCSFFLVPCIIEITTYGRTAKLSEMFTFDYNYFDIFSKTYIGTLNLNNTINSTSINIYCSTIILPLVYLYLINKNIDKKERRLTIIVIISMIIPCFVGIINCFWHLFTIPSFYSYRYSYLLCLFMILIGYKSITNLSISIKKIIFYLTFYSLISLYFIVLTTFGNYYSFLNYKLIWLTLLFLIIYFIILYKQKNKSILPIIIVLELIINIFVVFNSSKLNSIELLEDQKKFQSKIENLSTLNRIDVIGETNADIFKRYIYNDSLISNYRSTSVFLSTININEINTSTNIGLNEKIELNNMYESTYNSKIFNAIMGTEYIISSQQDYDYEVTDKIALKENYNIYKNNNYLSIGYIIKNKCNNLGYSFPYDEKVLNCLTNSKSKYYKEYELIKNDNNILEYNIKNQGYYILYLEDWENNAEKFEILSNANIIYISTDYIIMQNNEKNNKLEIKINEELKKENIKIYYISYKNIEKDIEKLKEEQLNYEIKENKLKGNITTQGGTLLITIPYEKGYKITIDGKKTNYEKVLDGFIGINIEPGNHEINLEYKQPGIKTGIIISMTSLLITIIYIYYEGRSKNEVK